MSARRRQRGRQPAPHPRAQPRRLHLLAAQLPARHGQLALQISADECSPVCAIDGKKDAACWRPGRRTDLSLNVEFGREITAQKVVLTLALAPGQTGTWTSATLEFPNGEKQDIALRCTPEPQTFTFPAKTCAWVKLTNLKQAFPLTDNGVSEFEVWGTDK